MIIPKISAELFLQDHSERTASIQKWGLFGQIVISDITSDATQSLESTVEKVGGQVDLIVQLVEPNNDDAVALLNAGASFILCEADDIAKLDAVPSERLVSLIVDDDTDQAISTGTIVNLVSPTASRVAELEMARIDCSIDANLLDQQPELIADFFQAVLQSDRPDGLWATLIVDPLGIALGLAYSNYESLLDAITHHRGSYWSRSRGELWVKGATSGATQDLLRIDLDCDRDCLRFTVTQDPPGFCHRETHTCFGEQRTIQSVLQRLAERIDSSDEKSFTKKLVNDPKMLEAKLLEEAQELSEATTQDHIAFEAADVLYFSLVKMLGSGVTLDQVYHELARRMNRVVRRKNKLES